MRYCPSDWNPYDAGCPPCGICGGDPEAWGENGGCICPECQVCGAHGDPLCYEKHGLVKTQAQIDSLASKEKEWEEENRRMFEAEQRMAQEEQTYWDAEEKRQKERVE